MQLQQRTDRRIQGGWSSAYTEIMFSANGWMWRKHIQPDGNCPLCKGESKQWYIAFGLAYIAAYNVYEVNEHEKAVEKNITWSTEQDFTEFFQALDQNLDRDGMEMCAVTMYFLWRRSKYVFFFFSSIWRVFKSSLVKIMSTNLRICRTFSFCLKLNYFFGAFELN